MNIKGQGPSLTLVRGHSDSSFSIFFSLETAKPIETKFHVKPSWDEQWKGLYKWLMSHDQDSRHAHIW